MFTIFGLYLVFCLPGVALAAIVWAVGRARQAERETQAWLKFVERMAFCPDRIVAVRDECNELVSILVASVRTARAKVKMSNAQ